MKTILGVIFLSLLLSGNVFAETTNKVASASGGTTQEVIVTHRNDYDIWDALVDYSRAIDPKNKTTTSSSSSNRGTPCVAQTTNSGVTIMNCD